MTASQSCGTMLDTKQDFEIYKQIFEMPNRISRVKIFCEKVYEMQYEMYHKLESIRNIIRNSSMFFIEFLIYPQLTPYYFRIPDAWLFFTALDL